MNGGTVMIMPKFSPQEVFRIAKEQGATIFAGVPTMYNYLLQASGQNGEDLSDIRFCISGGASMPVSLLKQFEAAFDVTVSEGYGLSEASPVTCFNPLDRPRKPGSIGTSIMNVENKVVDEFGEEVPPGEVGELVVRGPNVMKGYYKLEEETAAALKNGWLHTGDMARMDDEGYFYIVDRKKDMILVGGYNVYPREVEEVLYDHPEWQRQLSSERRTRRQGNRCLHLLPYLTLNWMKRLFWNSVKPIWRAIKCLAPSNLWTNCRKTQPVNCCGKNCANR